MNFDFKQHGVQKSSQNCFTSVHVVQLGKSDQCQVQKVHASLHNQYIISLIYNFRFLASGDSYQTLGGRFRLAACTVSLIVPKVCQVIWETLVDQYMPTPTEDDWKTIETGFKNRWNFPNCVGALDGKHVALRQPANTGSLFHNYKNHFSVVLMAQVDDQYRFTYVDVGNYGSNSDSGIFKHSNFERKFFNGELHLPPRKTLPAFPEAGLLPHCIVTDDAFPLRPDLLKPFPRGNKGYKIPEDQLIFNYRLSRARCIVENAFSILVQRWRVFDRRMYLSTHNATLVIQAATVLHNFLTPRNPDTNSIMNRLNPTGSEYNPETGALRNSHPRQGLRSPTDAMEVRNWYKAYFNNPIGAVPWQLDRVNTV